MKRIAALLIGLSLLIAPACHQNAEPDAPKQDVKKSEEKDMATRAGEAVEGAKSRAQELTDDENKRVDEVNAAMSE